MTTRHTLTFADQLFWGAGVYPPMLHSEGKAGMRMHPVRKYDFGAIATLDADGLIAAATSTELPDAANPGETVTYDTGDDGTSPFDNVATPAPADVVMADGNTYNVWTLGTARNITAAVTHGSSVVAMTILITGFDQWGQAMSELLTITATGTSKTAAGLKAFKHIYSIAITAAADASANTLNLGWGDVIGLPFKLSAISDLIAAFGNGVFELATSTVVAAVTTDPATTTTGDVRGTIDFATASDGTKTFQIWMHVSDPNSEHGLRGVDQA